MLIGETGMSNDSFQINLKHLSVKRHRIDDREKLLMSQSTHENGTLG